MLARIDGLIAFVVEGSIGARDVGWQGHMADLVEELKEVVNRSKAEAPFSEFTAGDDFRQQHWRFAEGNALSHGDFSTGADQAFPFVGIFAELPGEQNFDSAVQKIAGCGVVGTERLRLEPAATSVKASGKYASVVEDYQVIGPEELGKLAKMHVAHTPAATIEMEQAGSGAVREWLLSDLVLGQIVMELRDKHTNDYRAQARDRRPRGGALDT